MNRLAVALFLVAACGGANLNARGPGNREGGIRVGDQEIAVDPAGQHILVRSGEDLLIGDPVTRQLTRAAEIVAPRLLAFRAGGFLAVMGGNLLVDYDFAADRMQWRRPLEGRVTSLDVSPDGKRVVVAGDDVRLFDAATGEPAGRFVPEGGIEDVDVTSDSERIVVTLHDTWHDQQRQTTIDVVAAADGKLLCTTRVPNCSDELVLSPDGRRAYLAPLSCSHDPVSIVDVTATCRFEGNLPGFGPVALSPDGATGIAFLDRNARDPAAPPLPPEVASSPVRFHLMLFDTRSHALRTLPMGNDMPPRYLLTPDGKTAVVDGLAAIQGDDLHGHFRLVGQPIRLIDVASAAARTVSGPDVMLNLFAVDPGSQWIWLIHAADWKKVG
ncbi:MAG TPA: WD40 repeat domain-containing protein, partial [Kofleriaceae bacterium]|nr:WD40 repeat domain-containing protein [Kofleriaceae bacterium]